MNSAQRKALVTVLGLVVAGHALRVWVLAPGQPPGSVTLLPSAAAGVLDRQREAAAASARPLGPGEQLDLNGADAAALTRLPGVGEGLARRIVEYRDEHGPFRTLDDLDNVPGIGPALLRRVGGAVTQGAAGNVRAPGPEGANLPPGSGAALGPVAAPGPLDLNLAGEADLLRLPGIGPAKARAIVAYRQARGPFAAVGDLAGVSGIGPATLARLAGLVVVR